MNYLPTGTVYGVLLNFPAEYAALRPQMDSPPYQAPPQAPVLYVKPANTWSPSGASIALPADVPQVEVGATIGMVMGEGGQVAGWVLMNDLSAPHDNFFRPPVKAKCRDGFLGIGPALRPAGDPATFTLEVRIDGELRQAVDFAQLRRDAATLRRDVGEFMTLRAGDVLLLGCDAERPLAHAGQRIEICAPGFALLVNTLVAEEAA